MGSENDGASLQARGASQQAAQSTRNCEVAEKLRVEMNELHAVGEAQGVEFEMRLADAKSMNAVTAKH